MITTLSKLGSLLILLNLVTAAGFSDDAPVVFRKSIGDGKTIVVRESTWEEHRGPTKAEQDAEAKLEQQLASDPRSAGHISVWVKDRRIYNYTATMENSTNGVFAVWEKRVWDEISPHLKWSERLTFLDVAAKNGRLAIVYSSYREIAVDVLKEAPKDKYVLEYTQQICGLGSAGNVTEVHIEWLDELLIHVQPTRLAHPEVWKVRKGSSERIIPPPDPSGKF